MISAAGSARRGSTGSPSTFSAAARTATRPTFAGSVAMSPPTGCRPWSDHVDVGRRDVGTVDLDPVLSAGSSASTRPSRTRRTGRRCAFRSGLAVMTASAWLLRLVGRGVADLAELRDLLEARVGLLDLLPAAVAPVQRREARRRRRRRRRPCRRCPSRAPRDALARRRRRTARSGRPSGCWRLDVEGDDRDAGLRPPCRSAG